MKNDNDLKERTTGFALRIIKMYSSLPRSTVAQILGKQDKNGLRGDHPHPSLHKMFCEISNNHLAVANIFLVSDGRPGYHSKQSLETKKKEVS